MKHDIALTRDDQLADAIRVVRELLGDRDASKVRVEVTRGGTLKIDAEVEGDKVVRPAWGTGRK